MSRKKNVPLILTGIVLGMALSNPAAQAVQAYTAVRTPQTVYLDGQKVTLTAYAIEGHNYVQLCELGALLGADVAYQRSDNSVRIFTGSGSAPSGSTAASSGTAQTVNADGSINIPGDGSRYMPKAGDVIRCGNGTNYTITDVSRYGSSMFAAPVDELPAPTCDWSKFPAQDLPQPEVRRFQNAGADMLFVRNLYETRRMQYTLYNAIGSNGQTWKNGAPALRGDGSPVARVQLTVTDDDAAQSFWPWRPEQLTDDFASCPPGLYQLEAWDVFRNGVFLYTEYRVASTV